MLIGKRQRYGNWITVDDTGARHKAANGFCTQIGNEHFTWFGTTDSKSRLNFLELLRAGHGDYVINDQAIAYMRERHMAKKLKRQHEREVIPRWRSLIGYLLLPPLSRSLI